jgi:Tol biopolymer transport system component
MAVDTRMNSRINVLAQAARRPMWSGGWLVAGLLCIGATALASPPQIVTRLNPGSPPPAGGNGDSCLPVLSREGRFVLFASTANNLVLLSNGTPMSAMVPARFNVFLRDRPNQSTTLVSVNLTGTGGGNGDSLPVALSTNGQLALFESSASDLVAGDTNNASDIFLRDLVNGTTLLVSASTNGAPGNGASRSAAMTPDGQFVAFVSEATNLVAGDANRIADVFMRDVQAAVTTLVSVGARSTNATAILPGGSSESPEITPDGRFVAFSSTATNLVPGVSSTEDIYVRDVLAGTTIWASSGMRANLQSVTGKTNGVCYNLAVSDDGKFVAYQASVSPLPSLTYSGIILRYGLDTGVTDLVHTNAATSMFQADETRNLDLTTDGRFVAFTANTNGVQGTTMCIQVWDANSGMLTLGSGDLSGEVPTGSLSMRPVLDSTGRYVAFLSNAGLTTNPPASGWHLYVRDLASAATTLLDADTNGTGSALGPNSVPCLSADGRFTAFECADGNLVATDNNHNLDVFVRDLAPGTNDLISASHPALAATAPNGPSFVTPLSSSADGRFIAFASEADNLVANDTNGFRDVFVRDLATNATVLVSADPFGLPGNGISFEPVISGDGRVVAFTSSATNLVAGDTNKATDIFVRDLQTRTTTLASAKAGSAGPANKSSYAPALSADGRWLLFHSQATDLASGTFTGTDNLFLRDLQTGTNYALTTAGGTNAAMTPDGRFVAFFGKISTTAAGLYVWDSALAKRVYTNTATGVLGVAISPDGNRLAYVTASQLAASDRAANTSWTVASLATGSRTAPRFSADGRWLAFAYTKTTGATNQVYLNDLQTRTEYLASHATNSASGGNASSDRPEISPDGRFVAYRTYSSDVVPGASGATRQIVLYDRLSDANSLVTASRFTGAGGSDFSMSAGFSADGQTLLVQSWASDLAAGDANRTGDVFAYTILTAVILPSATPGQGPWISWPFVPGNNYRVQFKNNLHEPDWQELTGSITNVGVKGFQQDSSPVGTQRFYRINAF